MDEKESTLSEGRTEAHPPLKSVHPTRRWLLLVLLMFGLGALLITFALYAPARQMLEKANATVTGNTSQISTLQAGNATLQKNLDATTLHMGVLKALSGARGASLAVAVGDNAGALLSLTQTSQALDTLSTLLGPDHKDVLAAMQKSTAQALTDIKTDLKSAQPELDQLTKNLAQLEVNLFSNP
jgi:F0F1-type ATP synthase membrane subunit b/b'